MSVFHLWFVSEGCVSGCDKKWDLKIKKFSDVDHSDDGEPGEGLQNFDYYPFRAVMTAVKRQSRSGQRGLANESRPELARIGGNKLRLGRMQTGRDRLRAEVARVERQKERQETHLVWKRGGEKKQETAPVPPSTPPPVLKQSSNGCVYRPSILLPLSTQRFEDRRRKKKKKKKRVY